MRTYGYKGYFNLLGFENDFEIDINYEYIDEYPRSLELGREMVNFLRMKITLLLLVVVVMMMGLEVHLAYNPYRVDVRIRRGWLWGKRDVRNADFDAAYNAAAEDGVFTDDEIKSVFGVDVDEFKAAYDVNDDGVVKVLEYELVNKVNQDE
ncbi:hypothetical protein LOTGIDRAFT_157690 [Lottia gigantea]|uniref:EF-hand domain-containing protein n=1 Tax=Lottia gigantea TaxID=225164 RepID=V4AT82_LOTGI|nr:hypothetical protein LOTGIDRAFT_157690 [Lottia gigantea]ESP00483.1 hypothetical protein LOTGIDRAFT_157690 [Lottia gigantea]